MSIILPLDWGESSHSYLLWTILDLRQWLFMLIMLPVELGESGHSQLLWIILDLWW